MEFDLVFEGGGAKGMVFVGAMEEFFQRGHTPGRLMGTSAGAINAALMAAGYTPEEMLDALGETDEAGEPVFAGFMAAPERFSKEVIANGAFSTLIGNFRIPFLPGFLQKFITTEVLRFFATKRPANNLFSLVERGGWYSADNFLTWLKDKLDSGSFNGQPRQFSRMTMQQFHQATGKDLTLIAADTTGETMLVINHRTAADCPVVWAVRMSMSIPLLWQEVIWQPEWGIYRGADISGHAVVDGGLLSNFPIELFISNAQTVTALMGEKTHENVLGLLIDETLPVPGAVVQESASNGGVKLGELKTVKRLSGLMDTLTGGRDKAVISQFEHLVVRLPAKGYGTVEFDMSEERRNLLVSSGREAMKTYLDSLEQQTGQDLQPISPGELADRQATRMMRT
jgi:NTE family protein